MGAASLFFSFRTMFHLFEPQLPQGFVIFPILSVGFEMILIYRAIRGSLGYSPMTRSDIVMFFVFMGLGFLAGFVTSYSMDQVIHSLYVFYFFSRAAYFTLKKTHFIPVSIQVFILFYIVTLCFIMIFRGIYYLAASIETGMYSTDPLTASTTLFTLLIFVIGNLGVFVLAITRVLDGVLEERDFAKTLISVIGHDLSGYIGSARQATELIVDKSDTAVPLIVRNTSLAQSLLTDLVYWSRSLDGDLKSLDSVVITEKFVQNVVRESASQVPGKNVRIESSGDFPPFIIRIDQVSASVVLRNIFSNAVKFSPNNSVVRVSYNLSGEEVLVQIADSGPGMPREIREAVYKGDIVRSGIGSSGERGLGVGLKIITSICRSSGWSLDIKSESGEGTTVTVGFPLVKVEE